MAQMTPEQRAKHIKTIEKIENLKRPEKWREIKRLLLKLHPELVQIDHDFSMACKEIRQKNTSMTGISKGGTMRNSMKIPSYIYQAMYKLDPDLKAEMSGSNPGAQEQIGRQLYKAFPEYRVIRSF